MRILILSVGSIKKSYNKEGFTDYFTRIKRYAKAESVEVKDGLGSRAVSRDEVKKKEAERLAVKIKESDFVVALSEGGLVLGSKDFASAVEKIFNGPSKRVVFIIGGAYGLHASILDRADSIVSLSSMTMPHEIARLVVAEQIYRAFTIIRGEPYSH